MLGQYELKDERIIRAGVYGTHSKIRIVHLQVGKKSIDRQPGHGTFYFFGAELDGLF